MLKLPSRDELILRYCKQRYECTDLGGLNKSFAILFVWLAVFSSEQSPKIAAVLGKADQLQKHQAVFFKNPFLLWSRTFFPNMNIATLIYNRLRWKRFWTGTQETRTLVQALILMKLCATGASLLVTMDFGFLLYKWVLWAFGDILHFLSKQWSFSFSYSFSKISVHDFSSYFMLST